MNAFNYHLVIFYNFKNIHNQSMENISMNLYDNFLLVVANNVPPLDSQLFVIQALVPDIL